MASGTSVKTIVPIAIFKDFAFFRRGFSWLWVFQKSFAGGVSLLALRRFRAFDTSGDVGDAINPVFRRLVGVGLA